MIKKSVPQLSVIVVVHKMCREAPRTLYSLTAEFQQGVSVDDYEVIVVENQSEEMLSTKVVSEFGENFQYIVNESPSVSPAQAINLGVQHAASRYVMLNVDGARIVSPGMLKNVMMATKLYSDPVVASLAWHLGPMNQVQSIREGYDSEEEDRLLAESNWEQDGYQLFQISALAGSCDSGWFRPMRESNCITVSRNHFEQLGGFCEAFKTPGGGLINLDFYRRAVTSAEHQLVVLLGEGTFHQMHGGVATNRPNDNLIDEFKAEYRRIRGTPYRPATPKTVYFGAVPQPAREFCQSSEVNVSVDYLEKLESRRFKKRCKKLARLALKVCRKSLSKLELPALIDHTESAESIQHSLSNQRAILVLGMHRSGTSCLAGTLMECGVHLGEVSQKCKHNQKGNRENQQIMDLHDAILSENNGSWDNPPESLLWTDDHIRQRNQILKSFVESEHPCWGFKDPRVLFTLGEWVNAIPNLSLVGTFRHPESVAKSLKNRNRFPRQKSLNLWYRYNKRLLHYVKKFSCGLIYYDPDAEFFTEQLKNAVLRLNLEIPPEGLKFFEPRLNHCPPRQTQSKLPAHVEALFRQLQEYAFGSENSLDRLKNRPKAA